MQIKSVIIESWAGGPVTRFSLVGTSRVASLGLLVR